MSGNMFGKDNIFKHSSLLLSADVLRKFKDEDECAVKSMLIPIIWKIISIVNSNVAELCANYFQSTCITEKCLLCGIFWRH